MTSDDGREVGGLSNFDGIHQGNTADEGFRQERKIDENQI
jgi:hypothetical protein